MQEVQLKKMRARYELGAVLLLILIVIGYNLWLTLAFEVLKLDKWESDVRTFPIVSVDTDGLTVPEAQQVILDAVDSFYQPYSSNDRTAYRQRQIHRWSNLFSHPASSGIPFDQLAAIDYGAVYAFNDEFVLIPIYPGRVGSHDRLQPFLLFFDRYKNVYQTGLIGGLRDAHPMDNGYIFHFNQSTSSGDTQPFSVAHLIMNVDPPVIYSLGDFIYGGLGTPFSDIQWGSKQWSTTVRI